MKYFITGATGFIGGRVARQLVAAGHQVVALARTPAQATDLLKLGVAVHAGDIVDKESMRRPMTGVDGVFHIAAWYKIGARDKSPAVKINVEGTRHVLELMRELKIPKGVYTSTLAVFSDTQGQIADENYHFHPASPTKNRGRKSGWLSEYDRTKWLAHYEVAVPMMQAGLPLVIVQPGLVYGPGDTSAVRATFLQYLKSRLPAVPQKTAYCWAHVDDVAAGHLLAMEKGQPSESYIIAGPKYSFIEAFALAEKITGIKAPRLHLAPGILQAAAGCMGVVEKIFPLPEIYTSEALRVSAGVTYLGTNEKAKRELGYHVRPLEDGLQETLLHEMKLLGMMPKH